MLNSGYLEGQAVPTPLVSRKLSSSYSNSPEGQAVTTPLVSRRASSSYSTSVQKGKQFLLH